MKSVVLLLCLFLFSAALHAETAYISDDLNVAIRSGKTFQHRIMRFVPSGARVEVLQRDEDGYVLIRTQEGTEGWLEGSNLANQPHARDRLAQAERQLATLRDQRGELQGQIQTLRGERDQALGQVRQTQAELERLATEMENLRQAAARPLELAQDNERLRGLLSQTRARAETLERELAEVKQTEQREWFMVGAAVTVGSLLLGIILTRIRWRRRNDGWS